MPGTPPHFEVPVRLQPTLVDALADVELLRQRLDAAQQIATDFERHLSEAAKEGLVTPGSDLLEHCRTMTTAAQAAAGASFKVMQSIFSLRGEV